MACRQTELFRLEAADGAHGSAAVVGDAQTLVVLNPLAAPLYVSFSSAAPTSTAYDLAVPGESLMAYPIAGVSRITATADYPGAVPAGDVGQVAIFTATEALMGAFVGALNA